MTTKPFDSVQDEYRIPSYQNRRLFIVTNRNEQGLASIPEVGDDITDPILTTFAKYVSNLTKEGGNFIRLVDPATVNKVSLVDGQGNPDGISLGNENGQQIYLDAFPQQTAEIFRQTGRSNALSTTKQGQFVVKKGKETSTAPTGTDIYASLSTEGSDAPFAKRVQEVLQENNNFSAEHPYIKPNTPNDDNLVMGRVVFTEAGVYGPKKFPQTVEVPEYERLKIKDLKKLGFIEMLAASGDINIPSIDTLSTEAIGVVGNLTTLVPGSSRLGAKVNSSRFDPLNLISQINPNITSAKVVTNKYLDSQTPDSYGSPYNMFVQFSGPNSAGAVVSAMALVIAVTATLRTVALSTILNQGPATLDYGIPAGSLKERRRYMGSYFGTAGQTKNSTPGFGAFEFPPIQHPFATCLNTGLAEMFAIPQTFDNALGAAITTTSVISENQTFYNTVLRNVVRSAGDLLAQLATFSITNPAEIVKEINSSPLFKFISVLLTVGDRVETLRDQTPAIATGTDFTIADIDAIKETLKVDFGGTYPKNYPTPNPAILQAKHRLDNGKMAISVHTLKSLFLVPQNIQDAANTLNDQGAFGFSANQLSNNNRTVFNSRDMEPNKSRISQEIVDKFENYLEADYVPFYFHDLRTNEIISFHGFLSNVRENFSANYNETEGFGRIDSVQTYKNTKRELSFGFKVVAFSEEDFNEMWYRINRLAMSVYPQWTEGRRVSFGDNNRIIQPFSQLPGASPLFRVRIGDMIKSNYGKLSLARLFGLADGIGPNGAFNLQNLSSTSTQNGTDRQRLQDQVRSVITRVNEQKDIKLNDKVIILAGHSYRYSNNTGVGPNTPPSTVGGKALSSGVTQQAQTSLPIQFPQAAVGTVIAVDEQRQVAYVTSLYNYQRGGTNGLTPWHPPTTNSNRGPRTTTPSAGSTFIIPFSSLATDANIASQQVGNSTASPQDAVSQTDLNDVGQNADAVATFFSDANPIFKVFKTTRGRGLAGFVKSLELNTENAKWATDAVNGRAPMMVEISMNFTPVHDITPGLDANGFMRAPIWNVGETMAGLSDMDAYNKAEKVIKEAKQALVVAKR